MSIIARVKVSVSTRSGLCRRWLPACLFLGLWGGGIFLAMGWSGCSQKKQSGNETAVSAGYVGSTGCITCHPAQQQLWEGSDHHRAMQEVTEESVLGDFQDQSLEHFGVTSRFLKRDGKFTVHTEGPDGTLQDYPVRYVFGVRPLQQYLVEFPGGRLQTLPLAWDTEQKKWFHIYPDERIAPKDPLFWTHRLQNWNHMCADCHSTELKKGYDSANGTYQTSWKEIHVGCEACHGPASGHLKWAEESQRGAAVAAAHKGFLSSLKNATAQEQVDACARCHVRRQRAAVEVADPNGKLLDQFVPALLTETLYHADGQFLDEVYEYGSFTQSRMYHRGVRCSDCHNPHSLQHHAPGNALCVRCHQEQPLPQFPTLKPGRYDDASHHRHMPGTPGAQCVNCHMPERHYMVVDGRRDHSFRVPRPDLSVETGSPNACNQCHKDKTPQWAAEAVVNWYGENRRKEPHYGQVFAAARADRPEALPGLIALAADREQTAIVRATAIWELQRYPQPAAAAAVLSHVSDAEGLVRWAAAGGLERVEPADRLRAGVKLLRDSLRSVRIEAARVLGDEAMLRQFSPEQRRDFDRALSELVELHRVAADDPGAHLAAGGLWMNLGNLPQAERSLLKAIEIDDTYVRAAQGRLQLAQLYARMERRDGAVKQLETVMNDAEVPVGVPAAEWKRLRGRAMEMLGRFTAENPMQLADGVKLLEQASELLPEDARLHYNLHLGYQHLGKTPEAEKEILEARRLDPENAEYLLRTVHFYLQWQKPDQALAPARRLAELYPQSPQIRQLLQQVELERLRN